MDSTRCGPISPPVTHAADYGSRLLGTRPRCQMDTALRVAILCPMPTLYREREVWEHELREELPARLAAYQRELAAAQRTRRGENG